jgi:putative flippase GtrA
LSAIRLGRRIFRQRPPFSIDQCRHATEGRIRCGMVPDKDCISSIFLSFLCLVSPARNSTWMAFFRRSISADRLLFAMSAVIRQAVRFGAVGLINTIVGLTAIYSVLFFFGAGPVIANVIGYSIGLILSFFLNRNWTFDQADTGHTKLPAFLLVAGLSYLCNLGVVAAGSYVFGLSPYLVQLFGLPTYTMVMFLGCRIFVFTST